MITALGDLFVAFLIVLAAVCVGIAVLAIRDCTRPGREAYRGWQQMENARRVTGRVPR